MIMYSLQPEPFEYQKKKSDFKIQTLLNFLSSLLRAQTKDTSAFYDYHRYWDVRVGTNHKGGLKTNTWNNFIWVG